MHFRSSDLPDHHIWNQLKPRDKAQVQGVIVDLPQKYPEKTRYEVRLELIDYGSGWTPVTGTAWIHLYGQEEMLEWGTRVRFPPVRLRRPLNFRNPGRFDFEAFMRSTGIDVTGGTSRWKRMKALGPASLPWDASFILSTRQKMRALLEEFLPEQEQGLLRGLVFGDKSGLSPELLETYQETGMGHLLAVSGLHIGFVALVFFWTGNRFLFKLFWKAKPRWAQFGYARLGAALISLVAVVAYMALVGPRVSSLRAGVLVIAFLFAFWIHREREIVNTLLLAALLILVWDPSAVYGLGFQLSFLAAMGIVLALRWIAEPGSDRLERMGEIPWYRRWAVPEARSQGWIQKLTDILVAAAFISLAAWVFTFPVLLFQFHRVSLAAPLLNPFLVPLASLLIPASLMVLFVGLFLPSLAGFFLIPLGWLASIFVKIPSMVATVPGISVFLARPPWPWLVLFYLIVCGLAYRFFLVRQATDRRPVSAFWKRISPRGFAVGGCFLFFGLLFPKGLDLPDGKLHVWMLDVGQGEAIYVEFPNGQNLLLDGGGYFKDALDVGKRVVGDFLWDRGVGKIDFMGATHSDQDHIDGVESLLEVFDIGHFLVRPDGSGDSRYSHLVRRAEIHGIPMKPFGAGEVIQIGEVVLKNLHPTDEFNRSLGQKGQGRLTNDRSWVILLEYRNFRMLLTGDITERAERWLVENEKNIEAQVLKSPHHGSRTSSSKKFLDAVNPREIFISSGFANFFNHPHPTVVRRYRAKGARILNTGQLGALHLSTDGAAYETTHFKDLSHWN